MFGAGLSVSGGDFFARHPPISRFALPSDRLALSACPACVSHPRASPPRSIPECRCTLPRRNPEGNPAPDKFYSDSRPSAIICAAKPPSPPAAARRWWRLGGKRAIQRLDFWGGLRPILRLSTAGGSQVAACLPLSSVPRGPFWGYSRGAVRLGAARPGDGHRHPQSSA